MACADAEQAVQVAEFGPRAPKRIDTWQAARLMIADGMKNGEILRGPPSSSARCSRSIVVNPPIPEAMNTPTRVLFSAVTLKQASSIANCAAAIAYWMKTSIFLTSFFSMNVSGSKPRTSPAMRVANSEASNLVMVATPLTPSVNAVQFASVPMPNEDTNPIPVTTTRRFAIILRFRGPFPGQGTRGPLPGGSGSLLALRVRVDVLDRFLDTGDLLGVLVRDLDPELFLERHDQLHRVERVGAEVVDERCVRRHFLFVHAELLHDDALDLVGYRHHAS